MPAVLLRYYCPVCGAVPHERCKENGKIVTGHEERWESNQSCNCEDCQTRKGAWPMTNEFQQQERIIKQLTRIADALEPKEAEPPQGTEQGLLVHQLKNAESLLAMIEKDLDHKDSIRAYFSSAERGRITKTLRDSGVAI